MVLRVLPWIRTENGCVWVVSMAVSKSRRQINDWLKRKTKRKNVCRLDSSLTGRHSNLVQSIGVRKLRNWMQELPPGDSLVLRCESAKPDKQFQVWKKWFQRKESVTWKAHEEFKSFFYYKPRLVK
jgi:hypothetical protein